MMCRLAETAVVAGLLLVLAAVVYQPWRPEPIGAQDFSEFLPLLRGQGFWGGLANLSRYYASQGRANVLIYALLSFTYQLTDLNVTGWHVTRFVQMGAVVLAAYGLLRRLGMPMSSSAMGSSLFVATSVATGAWIRQTAEPMGTLFFFAAIGLAADFQTAHRWGWRAGSIVAAVLGMLLCKETFVACVPFVFGIATAWETPRVCSPPSWRKRSGLLATGLIVAVLAAGCLVVSVHSTGRPDAYANLYGTGALSGDMLLERFLLMVLPLWTHTKSPLLALLAPPNLVFVLLVLSALIGAALVPVDIRSRLGRRLLLSAVLVVAGIAIYLPWPRFELFYGVPFLFGPALAAAVLYRDVLRSDRVRAVWATAWAMLVVAGALTGFGMARMTEAQRTVDADVARWLAGRSGGQPVFVASDNLTPQSWQNPGATLVRYARAVGWMRDSVSVSDLDCAAASHLVGTRRGTAAVVSYVDSCGRIGSPDLQIRRPFSFFDWHALAMSSGVSGADIFLSQRMDAR